MSEVTVTTGLVQRDEPEVGHGLTVANGSNAEEKSGMVLFAWVDTDSPVATDRFEEFHNGINAFGAVRSYGPISGSDEDVITTYLVDGFGNYLTDGSGNYLYSSRIVFT